MWKTKRLFINNLNYNDWNGYKKLLSDPAISAANGSPKHVSDEVMKSWLKNDLEAIYAFSVNDLKTKKMIGLIFYYQMESENSTNKLELGYLLASSLWGLGLMSEAVQKSLEVVSQNTQDAITIISTVLPRNERSLGLLKKIGFHKVSEDTEKVFFEKQI